MLKRRPIFLLHGTSSKNLPSIKTEGLKNPYLTDQEKMAVYFADTEAVDTGGSAVILQVAIFDPGNLRSDREMWAEPLDWIRREHDIERNQEWFEAIREGYIDSPEDDKDWQTSLRMVHAVKYEGTILPSHLGAPRRPRA